MGHNHSLKNRRVLLLPGATAAYSAASDDAIRINGHFLMNRVLRYSITTYASPFFPPLPPLPLPSRFPCT